MTPEIPQLLEPEAFIATHHQVFPINCVRKDK
jgi:hypothetical protein